MPFILPELSDYKRRKLRQHAQALLQAQQVLVEQYGGLLPFMLAHSGHEGRAAETFVSKLNYPKGDRIDYISGGQYFYHCHREDSDTQEHGHFHLFMRKKGWLKTVPPAEIPEKDKYANAPMTHLVCVSLNRQGQPIRLFSVNRWVAYETWFEAENLAKLTRRYKVSQAKGDAAWQAMDAWIEHFVPLFLPQMLWVQQQRDAAMAKALRSGTHGDNPYEDRAIEELSSLPISLEDQVRWLM